MNKDVQRWITQEGLQYFKELGIVAGQLIVDFGCNTGNYTIPAAKVVAAEGIVYAIDKDDLAIEQLMKTALAQGLDNIVPIISDKPVIDLPAASIDAVLLYDVLHFLNRYEREKLYLSVSTVLKTSGILSVFPKHNKSDIPMWHLADLRISNITGEIERNHFILVEKDKKRLIHDDYFETRTIINFKKFQNKTKQ